MHVTRAWVFSIRSACSAISTSLLLVLFFVLSFALLIHLFLMLTVSVPHVFHFFDFYFMCPNIIFHLHVPSHCCGFAVCLLEWAQWVCLHGLTSRVGPGCMLQSFQAVLRLSCLRCGPLSPLSGSSNICQSVMTMNASDKSKSKSLHKFLHETKLH